MTMAALAVRIFTGVRDGLRVQYGHREHTAAGAQPELPIEFPSKFPKLPSKFPEVPIELPSKLPIELPIESPIVE